MTCHMEIALDVFYFQPTLRMQHQDMGLHDPTLFSRDKLHETNRNMYVNQP